MCSRFVGSSTLGSGLTVLRMQVFVANPKKPPQIEAILRRNREKLLTFLRAFHNDKEGPSKDLFLIEITHSLTR